ncbi:hypothetical protein E3P91_03646 [Wallemia ichthyophaga]|nr:hypothetical protein E3P91_03646 [Wallemia ichthyophaga]
MVSSAKTGFFYQCQRPRLSEKLSAIKYDPKVKQHVLFLEGKRSLDRANEAEGSLTISSLHNDDGGIQSQRDSLPIHKHRQKLLWMLERYQVTIVVGQTGCGKTTQLPQYVMEEGWAAPPYTIACTQPRRVAATSIAQRVAQEVGSVLGDEVGYTIRFEDLSSSTRTRLKYLTDGMLFRETLMDPLLSKYSVIMIDEAHERNSYTDILLGVLKKPDLRIVVSSATLTAEKFVDFFGGPEKCGAITLDGRMHPVEVSYTKEPVSDYVRAAIDTVVGIHDTQGGGDILVFLTGRDEIDRALQMLSDTMIGSRRQPESLMGLPLHAGLTSEEQLKIFQRPPMGVRKVVFSTNIAEASVTIDGIRYVVDSGFVKLRHFNPSTGIDILSVAPCSKASLTQRAGRSGRTAPGKTFRLFPESALSRLDESTLPEICRTDLTGFILQLKALGISNVLRFDYLDSPPSSMLVRALELLYALGALDDNGHLTLDLGMKMAEMPLDPMMAKILLNSVSFECSEEILTIAAMTSVQNPFLTHDGQGELERRKFVAEEGDHLTLLNAYNSFVTIGRSSSRWAGQHRLNFKALSRAISIRSQLSKYLEKYGLNPRLSAGVDQETIRRCLVSGYFKNAAKFNPDGTYTIINGNQIVHAHPSSVMFTRSPPTKWVIFHEIVETTKIFIRDLTIIKDDWLTDESLTRGFYQSNESSRNDAVMMSTIQLPRSFSNSLWTDDLRLDSLFDLLYKNIQENTHLSQYFEAQLKAESDAIKALKARRTLESANDFTLAISFSTLNSSLELECKKSYSDELQHIISVLNRETANLRSKIKSKESLVDSYLIPLEKLNESTAQLHADYKTQLIQFNDSGNELQDCIEQLPSISIKVPLLGERHDCFLGRDIFNWFRLKMKLSDEQTLDLCTNLPIRNVNTLKNAFESAFDLDSYYQFTTQQQQLKGVLDETLSSYMQSRTQLHRQRMYVEEVIEDTLKALQALEHSRLALTKHALARFNQSQNKYLSGIQEAVNASALAVQTFNPSTDLQAFIDQYKTGPFRPSIYQSPLPTTLKDSNFTLFGPDLTHLIPCPDTVTPGQRSTPLALKLLLKALDRKYADIKEPENVRKVWILDIPLVTCHNVSLALSNVPSVKIIGALEGVLNDVHAPIIAACVRLFALELNPPLGGLHTWEDARAVYPKYIEKGYEIPAQDVQKVLERVPLLNLTTLYEICNHIHNLFTSTSTGSENEDDVYLQKLSLLLVRSIFRPRVESDLTIQERHMTNLLIDLIKRPEDILNPLIERKSTELSPSKTLQRRRTKPIDERVLRSTFNSSISSAGSSRHLTPDELLDQLEFGSTGLRSRSTSIVNDSKQASPTLDARAPPVNVKEAAQDKPVDQPGDAQVHEHANQNDDDILDIIDGHGDNRTSYASADSDKKGDEGDNITGEETTVDTVSWQEDAPREKGEARISSVETYTFVEHEDPPARKSPTPPPPQPQNETVLNDEDDDAPPAFVTAAIEADRPVDDEEEKDSNTSSFASHPSRENSIKTNSARSSLNRGSRVRKSALKMANP